MICKKEFDNEHKTITLSFFNHNKCISWIIFEIVEGEYIFDKEIKNCFFADSFITSNAFKKKYYKESIDEIKKLNNKIVIELSNKDDKKATETVTQDLVEKLHSKQKIRVLYKYINI